MRGEFTPQSLRTVDLWLTLRSIRLGEHRAFGGDGALSTLASIPFFLVGAAQEGWAWVVRKVPYLDDLFTRRSSPYRQVPIDDDGECKGFGFGGHGKELTYSGDSCHVRGRVGSHTNT